MLAPTALEDVVLTADQCVPKTPHPAKLNNQEVHVSEAVVV